MRLSAPPLVADVWHSFRKAWWHLLWSMQGVGRVVSKKFPRLALTAMFVRWVSHWVAGTFPLIVIKAVVWYLVGGRVALAVTSGLAAVAVTVYVLATNGERDMSAGGGLISRALMSRGLIRRPVSWKMSTRTRGRWPSDWALSAAKTKRVQSPVSTGSGESRVSIRPVLDHPKISWWPQIEWPVISWWVSPPPGRTFRQFEEVLDVLAANMINVVSIELEYERPTSSIGRMSVLFADPLASPGRPVWDISDAPSLDQAAPVVPLSIDDVEDALVVPLMVENEAVPFVPLIVEDESDQDDAVDEWADVVPIESVDDEGEEVA